MSHNQAANLDGAALQQRKTTDTFVSLVLAFGALAGFFISWLVLGGIQLALIGLTRL